MTKRIAVYPGTFDPVTNGHIDLIERALRLFDKIVIGIGTNPAKAPLFTLEERIEMIKDTVGVDGRIEVASFDGLLVDFAVRHGACAILRGLRAVSDFDYELQRALMNRKLARDIETVFLMTGFRWIYISSTIVKEAARFGGSLEDLVPPLVEERLREKFREINLQTVR
ncbi:MAG: pantetheine-phosphate adenylyltransferase [Dissulfurimicrobium sp.]|uniref:pantetheine-phosphate adenylyltransferase n=1 Tax=Dissulfurimicrobium TaxID=1769732 RepID=UPI001EDB21EF|nr:pantetheine-phosphate adenylyltransferase [Dissulfurimicrobium hydrothermale]UKL14377.1 pantetheine-phosphate adenylyltransferase [Dissulfurimicrobium hydrothermale]